jgi:uncharacterized SAM-binding protein YcdF (DUF218 family)
VPQRFPRLAVVGLKSEILKTPIREAGRSGIRLWLTRAVRAAVAGLAALGLIVIVVTATPLVTWWAGELAGPWNEPHGDILIVLGGSILDDGKIGGSSYWRAIYGVRTYKEGGFKEVIVSGGGPDPVPVAVPIRDYMVCNGVPASAIRIETRSNSTRENALNAKQLLNNSPGKKVLLTSDFHMYRAHRVFTKIGLQVEPAPFPDVRRRGGWWLSRWQCFQDLVWESVKIFVYSWRGWI